tara:strand:- start:391 stop:696 length:306 start_codon:yes stop_codon:yes gene_type:complete
LIKTSFIIASIIFILATWATSNVCKYNYVLNKKAKIIKKLSEEVDISIGNTKIYYFKELNCNKATLNYDFSRIINNVEVISVMVYQYLTTDILGKSLIDEK